MQGEAATPSENRAISLGNHVKYGTHALCPAKRLVQGDRDGHLSADERSKNTRQAVHHFMSERPHGKA